MNLCLSRVCSTPADLEAEENSLVCSFLMLSNQRTDNDPKTKAAVLTMTM